MIKLKPHLIQETKYLPDGMGGKIPDGHTTFAVIDGVLDLLSGTDRTGAQNAITEDSTHVLVTLDYTEGITDKMRVFDGIGQVYDITYSDNPAGQDDHNELLLTLVPGVIDGQGG
ncbi:phage head completion protein [Alkalibacterium sp. f15]|uniref:phage head completion protein n=1 Tax=Alkalibacterium sp. f15 TaxID=3414029 RepID=UPI003BF7B493